MSALAHFYTEKLKSSKSLIDPQAIQILRRLKESGFQAYLVGGGVRDLLVHLKPKDFDIATNANPNEVRKKVPYAFIIGRRFKLVHARRGDQIYEIATFRRAASAEELENVADDENKAFTEENFFGNIEEDSFRRDFTVNSLFYDPIDEVIVDHCKGLEDIQSMTLRMIGSPEQRLIEDPIRILRAIRLSQKLNFTIEPSLRHAILHLKDELKRSAAPRRREEWIKFFKLANVESALMELFDLGVFETVLPTFHQLFQDEQKREDFLSSVRRIKFSGFDLSDNTELFSAIMHAFLQAENPTGFDIGKAVQDERFNNFCKEIGVFKAEFGTYEQAAHFVSSLKKRDSYLKKGERRQKSVIFHPTFLLSLKLGHFIHSLSASEFVFWCDQHDKYSNQPLPVEGIDS